MKKHNLYSILVIILLPVSAFCQNWTGALSSDWNNAGNWSTWPLGGEDIVINPAQYSGNAASPVISANSVFSPAQVVIENGGQLTISANLSTQDDVEVLGTGSQITVTNGTFSVDNPGGGRLIMDLGGQLLVNGGSILVGERFIVGEDALATVNAGNVSSGERMIMDLGGRIVQNGGTVSTAQTFAMADGSATYQSGYELNDGTLSITGEMAFENETGVFEPTFAQNGGSMTVNGDVFWFGEAPGAGTPRWLITAGTASVSGMIQNMPLSTVNLYLKVSGDGDLTLNNGPLELLHPQDSVIQEGNSVLHFNGNATVINPGAIHAYSGLTEVAASVIFSGSGSFQLNNLDINTGQLLNYQSPGVLRISGDLQKNGGLQMNTNPMAWNGTALQNVTGSGTLTLEDLTLENTGAGADVQLPVIIYGNLQLNQGIIQTTAVTPFVIQDNATASSGNEFSYVNGPMNKVGDDSFVFPVGKDGKWRRLGITAPASASSEFRAEYMDESYSYLTPVNSPLTAVSNLEYWQLDQLNGTSTVQLSVYWEDAMASAITDCAELSIAQANGSSWDNILSVASGSCTGTGAGMVQSNGTIGTFGAFTFGFYSGVTTQNVQICDGGSVTVGTNTYTTPGTYIDVLQDINSNDSIVVTTLTVFIPETGVVGENGGLQSLSAGTATYQWLDCLNGNTPVPGAMSAFFAPTQSGSYVLEITENGCVATSDCIDFTIVDATICNGESYVVGSNSYSISGSYTDQLTADSVVLTNLDVFTINTTISVTGLVISAANAGATGYEWIDCGTMSPIPGANASDYTATANGSYAVIVEEAGCIDTSSCLNITWASTQHLSETMIQTYPNPFTDGVFLQSEDEIDTLIVRDITGKVVSFAYAEETDYLRIIGEAGLYFLDITTVNNKHVIVQLIKK